MNLILFSLICILTHILQIRTPVGVFSIGLFTIPGNLPISEVRGGPSVFAEGSGIFLEGAGSSPPRGNLFCENVAEDSFLCYCCFRGIIQIQPPSRRPGTEQTNDGYPPSEGPNPASARREFYKRIPEINIREDLMNPAPYHSEISRRGTENQSPRIGSTPGLDLGPSLFSKEKLETGKVKCLESNSYRIFIKRFV